MASDTMKKWEKSRVMSGHLSGLKININPHDVMKWGQAEYEAAEQWMKEKHKILERNFHSKENKKAGQNPPPLLLPYVARDDKPYEEYYCWTVSSIRQSHEGSYEVHHLDHRGNCVDVWIDGEHTGSLSYEGDGFVGGKCEIEILAREGEGIDLLLGLIDMIKDGKKEAWKLIEIFQDVRDLGEPIN